MRDVKNNVEIGKLQKSELRAGKIEKKEVQALEGTEEVSFKDFSNPTEALGRSQVKKSDSFKGDVTFAMAQPKAISNADKLFDIAFKRLQLDGDPNAYENACVIATSLETRDLLSK